MDIIVPSLNPSSTQQVSILNSQNMIFFIVSTLQLNSVLLLQRTDRPVALSVIGAISAKTDYAFVWIYVFVLFQPVPAA
jgi:hypothetical protein